MKIGFIVSDLSNARIGGISQVATELGANLVKLGHEVVAYVLYRKRNENPPTYHGISISYIEPFYSLHPDYPIMGFSKRAFLRFCKDAMNERFDLLQSFNLNAISYPMHQAFFKKNFIGSVFSSFETIMMDVRAKAQEFKTQPTINIIPQIFYESYLAFIHECRYLRMADRVVTEDENTLSALEKMGVDREKIHLIPSGVDIEKAERACSPDIDVKRGLKGPVIGYIGRVDPRKGVQYLITSLKIVRSKYPEVVLFLAGGSRRGYDKTIQELINDNGLSGCVRYLGQIERDILPYYKLADVIVIPSLSEGIPITLGEAMAVKIPVVITKLPGVVPFIKPPDLVFWADIADPQSLSEAIIDALRDSEKEERIERAFNFIKNYSWMSMAKKYLEIYYELRHVKHNRD